MPNHEQHIQMCGPPPTLKHYVPLCFGYIYTSPPTHLPQVHPLPSGPPLLGQDAVRACQLQLHTQHVLQPCLPNGLLQVRYWVAASLEDVQGMNSVRMS
jgi:hypothetical protein